MKLEDLLKIITHQEYKVYLQTDISMITGVNPQEIKDVKAYLDCPVRAIDADWNISITQSGRMV